MKLRNKAMLGASVLVGGSVLLYATVNQIMNETKTSDTQMVTTVIEPVQNEKLEQPLTADIETEKSILEQKRKEREAQVLQQEKNAEEYLSEQQRIEAEALARSRAENQLYVKEEEEIARPVVIPRPKVYPTVKPAQNATDTEKKTIEKPKPMVVEPKKTTSQTTVQKIQEPAKAPPKIAEKSSVKTQKVEKAEKKIEIKTTLKANANEKKEPENNKRPNSYQVQRGEGLIQLSRRYDVPLEVLAKINKLDKNSSLQVGQKIVIPTEKQIKQSQKQLAQEQQKQTEEQLAKQREQNQKRQENERFKEADQKLKQARQSAKQNDAKGNFGVQIALATDQKKADEIVKQLQSAGYKARTSETTRGIRIVVGPEKGKEAALALKDKINADPKLQTKEAWVLFW